MAKFGIDVSKWQGSNFDFGRAKREDGIEFVVLRGAYSVYKDTQFENYYAKCKSLNLPVGVYHYSMATTVAEAEKEAKYLYDNVLKNKQFELPIYIDVEDKVQLALPKQLLTEIVKTWCNYLESRNYFVGIYAGKYTFQSDLDDAQLKRYTHWIPMWGKNCTYEDKSVLGMWQFGGETNVINSIQKKVPVYEDTGYGNPPGKITGYKTITVPKPIAGVTCDQNYMYVDFPAVIKSKKLNGFGTAVTTPKPIASSTTVKFNKGDKVKLTEAAKYNSGKPVPNWVKKCTLYVRSDEFSNGDYNVSLLKVGAITGRVNKKYLRKV